MSLKQKTAPVKIKALRQTIKKLERSLAQKTEQMANKATRVKTLQTKVLEAKFAAQQKILNNTAVCKARLDVGKEKVQMLTDLVSKLQNHIATDEEFHETRARLVLEDEYEELRKFGIVIPTGVKKVTVAPSLSETSTSEPSSSEQEVPTTSVPSTSETSSLEPSTSTQEEHSTSEPSSLEPPTSETSSLEPSTSTQEEQPTSTQAEQPTSTQAE